MTQMTMTQDLSRFGTSFSRNPYFGQQINQCTDESVLCWKLNKQIVNPKNSERVKQAELLHMQERLIELGGGQNDNGTWVDSRTFSRITCKQDAFKFFSCNPLIGQSIEDCKDVDVLCWKLNRDCFDYKLNDQMAEEERQFTVYIAEKLGCRCINNQYFAPDQLNDDWFKLAMKQQPLVEANEPIEIEMKYNIKVDGTIRVGLNNTFLFPHKYYRETYYYPSYSLPIDRDGNTKRVKGLTIRINKYSWSEDQGLYNIEDWEIVQ